MRVTVLVTIVDGAEDVSLHANESEAWTRLIGYVDGQWRVRFGKAAVPEDEAERARQFFEPGDDAFIIGDVDLTDIAEDVDRLWQSDQSSGPSSLRVRRRCGQK